MIAPKRELTPNLIAARAETHPDLPFVVPVDGSSLSYGELHGAAMRWASAFQSLGVGPGDRIASMARAHTAYAPWLGAAWLRAVHVPVNPELRGGMLVAALRLLDARVLIAEPSDLPAVTAVAAELPELRHVVVLTPTATTTRTRFSVSDAGDMLATAAVRDRAPVEPDDVDTGIFTSGTSGASKCVLRTWAIDWRAARWLFPQDKSETTPEGAYYSPWPTFHALGLAGLAISAQREMRVVSRPKFSVENYWRDVRRFGCTHSTLLVVAPLLAQCPPSETDRDNPLRYLTIVPLPRAYRELENRFDVRIGTMYGQTETGAVLAAEDPSDFRTAGRPTPGMEVRLVNEQGAVIREGRGELVVRPERPEYLSAVYLGMASETQNKWRNGWFHTGTCSLPTPQVSTTSSTG